MRRGCSSLGVAAGKPLRWRVLLREVNVFGRLPPSPLPPLRHVPARLSLRYRGARQQIAVPKIGEPPIAVTSGRRVDAGHLREVLGARILHQAVVRGH